MYTFLPTSSTACKRHFLQDGFLDHLMQADFPLGVQILMQPEMHFRASYNANLFF
jgi:hypothetical protein